jgi:hypothetical protein
MFMILQIIPNLGKCFMEIKWPVQALCKYWLRMPEDNQENRSQDEYSKPGTFDWEAVMWTTTPTSVSAFHNVLPWLLFLFVVYIVHAIGVAYVVAGTVTWVVFLPCSITDIQLTTSPAHLCNAEPNCSLFCKFSDDGLEFKTVQLASKWYCINRPLTTKVFWWITF